MDGSAAILRWVIHLQFASRAFGLNRDARSMDQAKRDIMNMPTLRGGKVQALGCLLLVASVMSGKLGLDRFVGGLAASHWLEIRLWTLAGALLLLRASVRSTPRPSCRAARS